MRIKDAGVAGTTPWPKVCLLCAIIAGDCVTEPGLGGGPISSRGSGDIESASEPSRLRGACRPLDEGRLARASCISSVTSLGGMSDDTVAFRRPGFTMGDCRTRPAAVDGRGAVLRFELLSFLPCSDGAIAASPSISMSTSTGDAPVELPEVVYWLEWCCVCW